MHKLSPTLNNSEVRTTGSRTSEVTGAAVVVVVVDWPRLAMTGAGLGLMDGGVLVVKEGKEPADDDVNRPRPASASVAR